MKVTVQTDGTNICLYMIHDQKKVKQRLIITIIYIFHPLSQALRQTRMITHTFLLSCLFDAPPFCTELLRRLIMVYIQYNSHTLQLSAQQEKRQQFHLRGAKNFPPGLEVSARAERLLKRRDMRNSAFLNPPPKLAKTRLSFPHSPSFFWTSHVNIII